ncbi:MAG: hypothetical protein H0T73_21865 [Ardenticatenales bacterium]|nr:hypothetical protein [Ardenticatenales bacterium]
MKHLFLTFLLCLLVACGREAAPPAPESEPTVAAPATSEPTTEPEPTAEPTATEEPEEVKLPEGWKEYAIEEGHMTLGLPESFYVFKEGDLDQEAITEEMAEVVPAIAEQIDLGAMMQQGMKLYAMDVDTLMASPDDYPVTVNVIVSESGEVPLGLLLRATSEQMEGFGAKNMATPEEITVNGQEMGLLEYDFTYAFPDGDKDARLRQVFFIVEGDLHVVTFTTPLEPDDTLRETIDAIIQQIRVIEE